ncbi:hypothetical protein CFR72_12505 [Gluconacetobacter entanii]|uniref:Uncharacterized protein n=1 Tax=Gluconacetobacter entanii TaxID=108528 RepID=A0A318Q0M8_9PROT|nr:hypothetical protein CFR72_12505 [Gluconacetobacter entanii]
MFQEGFSFVRTAAEKQKEVFGEAFFKKLQKDAAFLKKGSTQKLLFFTYIAIRQGSGPATVGFHPFPARMPARWKTSSPAPV